MALLRKHFYIGIKAEVNVEQELPALAFKKTAIVWQRT
jgi:hypothetical protein